MAVAYFGYAEEPLREPGGCCATGFCGLVRSHTNNLDDMIFYFIYYLLYDVQGYIDMMLTK